MFIDDEGGFIDDEGGFIVGFLIITVLYCTHLSSLVKA